MEDGSRNREAVEVKLGRLSKKKASVVGAGPDRRVSAGRPPGSASLGLCSQLRAVVLPAFPGALPAS